MPRAMIRPRGYKTFSILNSAEHEISNAHKYKNIKEFSFSGSDKPRMLFFLLINVKMPNSCSAELSMEYFFIISGPDLSDEMQSNV